MAIVITKQPSNFTAVVGDTVIFSVEATGVTEYQWQVQVESGYWNDLTWAGNNSATMSRALNINNIQYRYRCKLTGADGEVVYTNIVKLVNIVITKQPVSVAVNVNDTVSIILEATGDGLVYDWQYSTNATKFYSLSTSASASNWTHDQPTLTFRGYSSYLKYYFRCKITDANGDSVLSNIVRAINLAEAGAGFILPETMHSLADAIRAKTETSAKMLPAEMAAMIEGIVTGGTVRTGTFITPSSGSSASKPVVSLGVSLPECDNFVFFCICGQYKGAKWAYVLYLNGKFSTGLRVFPSFENPVYDDALVIDTVNGTFTYSGITSLNPSTEYTWYYAGLDEVYGT